MSKLKFSFLVLMLMVSVSASAGPEEHLRCSFRKGLDHLLFAAAS